MFIGVVDLSSIGPVEGVNTHPIYSHVALDDVDVVDASVCMYHMWSPLRTACYGNARGR